MSFALKGFLTGAFKAANERRKQEKEDTRELLATRTKNAYQNYLTHQESVNALKDEIKQRDARALQYQPDLTEQERVAIASMPNAIDLYEKALQQGMKISLRDVVKVNPNAENISFSDFVTKIGKVEAATVNLDAPKNFLGVSQEKQKEQFSKLTGSVGMTPEQLMAYEKLPERPSVTPSGSVDFAKLQKPKGLNERIEELTTAIVDARMNKQDVTAQQKELDTLLEEKGKVLASQLDPDQKRERRKAELMVTMESGTATPSERKAAQQELLRMANSEKMYALASTVRTDTVDKPASMAQFKGVVSMATGSAGKVVQGVGKLVNLETNPYAPPIYTIDGTEEAKRRFNEERDRLIGIALRTGGYVDKNGKLLDNDYAAVLSSAGIDVQIREDGGRYVMENSKAAQARRNGTVSEIVALGISKGMSDIELMEQGFLQEEINSVKNVNARGRR